MKLLSRYIAATFLKFWSLSLLALLLLVIVANLFGNLDTVFASRAGLLQFAEDTIRSLPKILDLLARHGVHATFFLIGDRVPGCLVEPTWIWSALGPAPPLPPRTVVLGATRSRMLRRLRRRSSPSSSC